MKSYSVSCRRFPNSRAFSHSSSRAVFVRRRRGRERTRRSTRAGTSRASRGARPREGTRFLRGSSSAGSADEPSVPGRERVARAGLLGVARRPRATGTRGRPRASRPGAPGVSRNAGEPPLDLVERRARPARTSRRLGSARAKSSHDAAGVPSRARKSARRTGEGKRSESCRMSRFENVRTARPRARARSAWSSAILVGGLRPARQRETRVRRGMRFSTSRSESRSTGSCRGGPGKRASSRPRTNVHGRPDQPARPSRAAWTCPGAGLAESTARPSTASRRRSAASSAGSRRSGSSASWREEVAESARPRRRRGRSPARGESGRSRRRTARVPGRETDPRETGGSAAKRRVT